MINIYKERKIAKLTSPETQKYFAIEMALVQYIGVNCRQNICAAVQLIAPGSEPTTEE